MRIPGRCPSWRLPIISPPQFTQIASTMSNISGHPSRDSDLQLLLNLVSAEIDGELADDEVAQLRTLQERYPGESQVFRSRCETLRIHLQRMPVRAANLRLSLGESIPGTATVVRSGTGRIRRWGLPAAFGATAAVIAMVMLLPMINVVPPNQTAGTADGSGAYPKFAPDAPSAAVGNRYLPEPAGPMPGAPAGAAAASAVSGAPAFPERPAGEFPTADNWRILVVRLQEQDSPGIRQEVAAVLERHGLRMSLSRAASMPEWLGVCIPSTLPVQSELLADVQEQFMAEAPEMDPAEIMRFSREEILRVVQESLKSPTQAELSGGELFVASRSEMAQAKTSELPGKPSVSESGGGGAEDLSRLAAGEGGQFATLLVFEFRQGGSGGGLRRIVQ